MKGWYIYDPDPCSNLSILVPTGWRDWRDPTPGGYGSKEAAQKRAALFPSLVHVLSAKELQAILIARSL